MENSDFLIIFQKNLALSIMGKKTKPPGIYIEEIRNVTSSVASVETAIPAFIGYTEKAEKAENSLLLRPTRISSMAEFSEFFGGKSPIKDIAVEVDETNNYSVQKVTTNNTSHYLMYDSLRLFYDNGGGDCYIVSVGFYGTAPVYGDETDPENIGFRNGLKILEDYDEPTLILFPDAVNAVTNGKDDAEFYSLQQMALRQCGKLQDRFCILDLKENIKENNEIAIQNFRNNLGSSNLKFGAAYSPFLISSYPFEPELSCFENGIINSAAEPVSLLDLSSSSTDAALIHAYLDAADEASKKSAQTMMYREHPVISKIVGEIRKTVSTLPPSGAIAGIYAQVDKSRGVWKSPANVSLNSVMSLSVAITSEMQESMNVDINGKSINAIRFFPGKGIMVWGARTLAGNDNEWRYIAVRRLVSMIQESVRKAYEQFIFEPNDANTWVKVKAMTENYLTGLWRKGAIMGSKPEQAFFVGIGMGRTITYQDILEGRMILEIGIAPLRPAEFIIIRIIQQMGN